MKLLILTQKVDKNDDVLGFFHDWIREFSKHSEKITVICLYKGKFDLPANVRVLSLGKEAGASRIKYLFNFYRYIMAERKNYDSVFVHMNVGYVILGSFIWKILNKKIGLWYVHKAVDWKLRLAEKLTDVIFTASQKSFRLKSDKVKVFGHGIDTDKFKPSGIFSKNTDIISVGRIALVKNYGLLIDAAKILDERKIKFNIKIAGAPILDADKFYFEGLKKRVKENNLGNKFHFIGSIPHGEIMDVYSIGKIFVNLSDTGSIDKAVLEAMSAGLLVLTSNEAFRNILADKYFTSKDSSVFGEKLIALMNSESDPSLRKYVVENHSLKSLIGKIFLSYE